MHEFYALVAHSSHDTILVGLYSHLDDALKLACRRNEEEDYCYKGIQHKVHAYIPNSCNETYVYGCEP